MISTKFFSINFRSTTLLCLRQFDAFNLHNSSPWWDWTSWALSAETTLQVTVKSCRHPCNIASIYHLSLLGKCERKVI